LRRLAGDDKLRDVPPDTDEQAVVRVEHPSAPVRKVVTGHRPSVWSSDDAGRLPGALRKDG
jgi:hypothetical protein